MLGRRERAEVAGQVADGAQDEIGLGGAEPAGGGKGSQDADRGNAGAAAGKMARVSGVT